MKTELSFLEIILSIKSNSSKRDQVELCRKTTNLYCYVPRDHVEFVPVSYTRSQHKQICWHLRSLSKYFPLCTNILTGRSTESILSNYNRFHRFCASAECGDTSAQSLILDHPSLSLIGICWKGEHGAWKEVNRGNAFFYKSTYLRTPHSSFPRYLVFYQDNSLP